MVNSDELICTAEYLKLLARCRIKRCRCERVRLYFAVNISCFRGMKFLQEHLYSVERCLVRCVLICRPVSSKGSKYVNE
jgi:hypothetical protein